MIVWKNFISILFDWFYNGRWKNLSLSCLQKKYSLQSIWTVDQESHGEWKKAGKRTSLKSWSLSAMMKIYQTVKIIWENLWENSIPIFILDVSVTDYAICQRTYQVIITLFHISSFHDYRNFGKSLDKRVLSIKPR